MTDIPQVMQVVPGREPLNVTEYLIYPYAVNPTGLLTEIQFEAAIVANCKVQRTVSGIQLKV